MQIKKFDQSDWLAYFSWVGLMLGLFLSVSGFLTLGWVNQVEYPGYTWNIPFGIFIFMLAIAFDTIGHRTSYKQELQKGEALVHHITIFSGITSILVLTLGFQYPVGLRIPGIVLLLLSVFYSIIDEALHWRRYLSGQSDRVEMWSHFFIFLGHNTMVLSWYQWFIDGYPGVSETLTAIF